tara:strand:- start:387 stop:758 length:372 start_codon:yes stop_codon:yes gene_type:complete
MGNRAVIHDESWGNVGIYLHWNGGRNSVEQFLKYAKEVGIRSGDYGCARLVQIIGNYLGGTMAIGVGELDRLDTESDNGTYIIKNWEIVERKHSGYDVEQTGYEEVIYRDTVEVNREPFYRRN